jgi:hypothetical protein
VTPLPLDFKSHDLMSIAGSHFQKCDPIAISHDLTSITGSHFETRDPILKGMT